MLQSIRDKTHGWIAGVVISLLILSFALWGIHSYIAGGGSNNVVATVNGADITKNQLATAYERLHRQLQMQSGTAELPQSADTMLRNRALQSLIQVQVLEQAAYANHYRVTSGQMDGFLQATPEFQVNGSFSPVRFQQVLNAMFFTVPEFIDLTRATLLADQPRVGILLTAFAMPDEVTRTMALIGQERNIRYLLLSASNITQNAPAISDEMIQRYYTEHQNAYKTPEQISVEYILLSVQDLADKMHPTEEQLKNFYTENMSSFKSAKSSVTPSYATVRDQVKKMFVQEKAEEAFADLKEKAANVTYEHPDSLQSAAQLLNVPVRTTPVFTKDQPGPDIAANPKVRETAFGNDVLNLQNNSDVIELDPKTAVILRVKSHIPAAVLSLDVVRPRILNALKAAALENEMANEANEVRNQLQSGALSSDKIAEKYHLKWVDAGWIGRHAGKMDQAILNQAFQMPTPADNKKITYAVTKTTSGFAIIGLSAVRPGNTQVSPEQYQAFADQIQGGLGTLEYALYENSLMRKAKVTVVQNG